LGGITEIGNDFFRMAATISKMAMGFASLMQKIS
jgi:hypothetical protein